MLYGTNVWSLMSREINFHINILFGVLSGSMLYHLINLNYIQERQEQVTCLVLCFQIGQFNNVF